MYLYLHKYTVFPSTNWYHVFPAGSCMKHLESPKHTSGACSRLKIVARYPRGIRRVSPRFNEHCGVSASSSPGSKPIQQLMDLGFSEELCEPTHCFGIINITVFLAQLVLKQEPDSHQCEIFQPIMTSLHFLVLALLPQHPGWTHF